jgi:hypothetical protein
MADLKLPVADTYRSAFRLALLQQIPWAMLCLLMLDFGRSAKICGIAMLAFWVAAFIMMARRPESPTRFDMGFIRWAFFPIFVVTFLLAEFVAPYLWLIV